MKKSVCKIDIDKGEMKDAKTDMILEVAVSVPKPEAEGIAVLKTDQKNIDFKVPRSPLH